MNRWLLAFVVALALSGCGVEPGRSYPTKPDQESAVAILVNSYGLPYNPEIEWIEGDRLDCGGTAFSVKAGGSSVCVGGWTYSDAFMQVAWLPGHPFSKLRVSHEFEHADLYFTTGSGEADLEGHGNDSGPLWGPDGEVGRGNMALEAASL